MIHLQGCDSPNQRLAGLRKRVLNFTIQWKS